MPVPVPRRRSSPPSSPSIAELKKLQLGAIQPPSSPTPTPPMNGHANGHANGHTNGSPVANGGMKHRRRHSKKNSNGYLTPSDTGSSHGDEPTDNRRDEDKEGDDRPNTPSKQFQDITFDEWTGIMKRIVDEWEIPRKVLHTSIGFGVLYLYSTRPDTVLPVIYSLSASLAIIVPTDILRLRSRRFERIYEKAVGFLMRESERHTTNGVIWYMVGVIYALALLPRDIAVVAILILSWCDTAASTFGRLYGRLTPPLPRRVPLLNIPLAARKSVAGSAAGTLTGALIAVGFWGWAVPAWQGYSAEAASSWGPVTWKWDEEPGVAVASGGWLSLLALGAVTGIISGVTEALDLGRIDDNLSLPIISGTLLWGLSKLMSWFSS